MRLSRQGPARWVEGATLPLIAVGLSLLLFQFGHLALWDSVLYDWYQRFWDRNPSVEIVIVGIDEQSLDTYGPWPFQRSRHAELVDILTEAGARAIVLDMVFAEPQASHPGADEKLAGAMRRSGRVVLPVANSERELRGPMFEQIPIPPFASAAAGMGHIDLPLDPDGIVRRVFLKAGLGEAFWPHVALAAATTAGIQVDPLPGLRSTDEGRVALGHWVRDHQIWIPFARSDQGRQGLFFQYASYRDVLQNPAVAAQMRDKIALVGAVAPVLGDRLPTPVSGENQAMPGVEILAHVLNTLLRGQAVVPMGIHWQLLLTALLVVVPTASYARLRPRIALLIVLTGCAVTVAASYGLFVTLQLWFRPFPAVVGIAVGYLIWSWRRLEQTVRYLNQELRRLHEEPKQLPGEGPPNLERSLDFLSRLAPIRSGVLKTPTDQAPVRWKSESDRGPEPARAPGKDRSLWVDTPGVEGTTLTLEWRGDANPSGRQQAVLADVAASLSPAPAAVSSSPVELIQTRIMQVQEATSRLSFMRRFITNSMDQMADGLIVSNNAGRVLMGNAHAATSLGMEPDELTGRDLGTLLDRLEYTPERHWVQPVGEALFQRREVQFAARSPADRDLLLQAAPLEREDGSPEGLIVNISDVSELRASERRRAELLSFLSHDLRSPLVSVLALTNILKLKPERAADGNYMERIENQTRKTLDLADDLLQLARAESSEALEFNTVDLVDIARAAAEQVRAQAVERNTGFTTELESGPLWVRGETSLLERMLVNLLTNAVKYSPEESSVEVSVRPDEDRVLCEVADTGFGIPEEDLPKLFDRFHRVDREEHRSQKGTGLGLAFVKSVVDRHDGEIRVESELGVGTRFLIYLPAQAPAEGVA